MDSRELRIGNYIQYCDMKAYKVVGFDDFGIDFDDEEVILSSGYEYFEPEPLTEEWLIKFGFKLLRKDEFNDYTQIVYGKSIIVGDEDNSEKLVIYLPFNRCEIGEYNPKDDDYSYVLNIDINYVHQAQNLFYSLTNTEL